MPWKIVSSETDPTAPRTLLEYDSMHQRVAKRGPEKTTIYAGDLYECEGTTPWTGNTVNCSTERFKIYGAGKLVAVVTKGDYANDTGFVHSDRLGSSSLITDVQGKQVQGGDFDAFGAPKGIDFTSTGIKSGFTGQEHDAELGLINMGGRLYDPAIGRFITAEPFVSRPFDPQGLNRFSYVQNNPLNATDPSGFFYEGYGGGGGYNGGYSGSYSGGGVGGQGSSGSPGAPGGGSASTSSVPGSAHPENVSGTAPALSAAEHPGEPSAGQITQQEQAKAALSEVPSFTPTTSPQGGAGAGWAYQRPSGGGSGEGASSGALKDASSNAAVAGSGGAPSWSPGYNGGASSYGSAGGDNRIGGKPGASGAQGENGAGQSMPGVHQGSALESVLYSAPLVIVAPEVLAGLLGAPGAASVTVGIRIAGGGLSGGLSPTISGKSGTTIVQGVIVGAAFGGLNVFGSQGLLPIGNAVLRGGMNSLLTNGTNQSIGMAMNGSSISWVGLGASFAGGAFFGGIYGNVDVGKLGIPVMGTAIQQGAKGVGMGLVSGAIQFGVNF